MTRTRLGCALLAVLITTSAAREARADIYSDIALRVFLGFRAFNDDSALGDQPPGGTAISNGAVVGLRAEYALLPWLAVEGEIPATLTDSRDELASLLFFDPRMHGRVALPRLANGSLRPFAVAGLSIPIVLSDNQSGLETDVTGGFYGGVAAAFEPRLGELAARLDVRVDVLQARGDRALTPELQILATVYRARPDRWARKKMAATDDDEGRAPPPDSDGDDVPDDSDRCPDRPEDKDGFEDADGCPDIDNDLDRVLDIADTCPKEREVLNGFQDEDGCADQLPEEIARLEGVVDVRFQSGTATMTGQSFAILRDAAAALRKYPSVRIEVGGHTDDKGDESENQVLSQQRADAVVEYLIRAGIDDSRLRAVGYGPYNPLADNRTAVGRRQNRRVEFRVIRPQLPEKNIP